MAEKPTAQAYFLGDLLRRLRQSQGLTLAAVAESLEFSESKMSRIEGGRSKISPQDVRRLLDLYEVRNPKQRKYLIDFSSQQASRPTGWWREQTGHHDRNVPQYLSLESVASRLRNVEPMLIPGLLQTAGYMTGVLSVRQSAGEALERETSIRARRQERLTSGELEATFLIGEVAIKAIPQALRAEQLGHLAEVAALSNITLRVIPMHHLARTTFGNPIVLLTFPFEGLGDVAYVEHWASSFVVDEPETVACCESRFSLIASQCMSERESLALIDETLVG